MQDIEKPQWFLDHEKADAKAFTDINGKLDELLRLLSAFQLGGRGVTWFLGILFLIGSIIALFIQLTKGA